MFKISFIMISFFFSKKGPLVAVMNFHIVQQNRKKNALRLTILKELVCRSSSTTFPKPTLKTLPFRLLLAVPFSSVTPAASSVVSSTCFSCDELSLSSGEAPPCLKRRELSCDERWPLLPRVTRSEREKDGRFACSSSFSPSTCPVVNDLASWHSDFCWLATSSL